MSFLSHLEAAVKQVDGAVACSIMGYDGISVETHTVGSAMEDLDLNVAWIEFANLLNQLKGAVELLKTGGMTEVSINTEKVLTLVRMVTPEYFLVMALKPEGNYGKARYVLRLTVPKVKAELL